MDFSAKHIPNIDRFSEKVHIIDQSLLKWTDLGALEGFGEETDKNHREEISKLAKKLFWNIGYDGEGSISIRNL